MITTSLVGFDCCLSFWQLLYTYNILDTWCIEMTNKREANHLVTWSFFCCMFNPAPASADMRKILGKAPPTRTGMLCCVALATTRIKGATWYIRNNYHLGVSENSVPHCTQWFCWSLSLWNGYFIGNINPTFSDKPIWKWFQSNPFMIFLGMMVALAHKVNTSYPKCHPGHGIDRWSVVSRPAEMEMLRPHST